MHKTDERSNEIFFIIIQLIFTKDTKKIRIIRIYAELQGKIIFNCTYILPLSQSPENFHNILTDRAIGGTVPMARDNPPILSGCRRPSGDAGCFASFFVHTYKGSHRFPEDFNVHLAL